MDVTHWWRLLNDWLIDWLIDWFIDRLIDWVTYQLIDGLVAWLTYSHIYNPFNIIYSMSMKHQFSTWQSLKLPTFSVLCLPGWYDVILTSIWNTCLTQLVPQSMLKGRKTLTNQIKVACEHEYIVLNKLGLLSVMNCVCMRRPWLHKNSFCSDIDSTSVANSACNC